jgi:hypothetical protein
MAPLPKRQNIDLSEKHDDFYEDCEQTSPEHQRKSAYGGGSGLTEGNASPLPIFSEFVTQLKAIRDTTTTLAATTDDPVIKGCLMSPGKGCLMSAGHFLNEFPQRLRTVEEKLTEVPSLISTQIENKKEDALWFSHLCPNRKMNHQLNVQEMMSNLLLKCWMS